MVRIGVLAILCLVLLAGAEAQTRPTNPFHGSAPEPEEVPTWGTQTMVASRASDGGLLSGDSHGAMLSGDGRWVFFSTRSPEAGGTVLAHEVATGLSEALRLEDQMWWTVHAVSHDGRHIVVAGEPELGPDSKPLTTQQRTVALHDRVSGTTPLGKDGLEVRAAGGFTRDGALAVLASNEHRLEAHMVKDGAWQLIHAEPAVDVMMPALSGDGRYAAFIVHHEEGPATYVKRLADGHVARLDAGGAPWPEEAWHAPARTALSMDGRFVAFEAWSEERVRVFLHDRQRNETAMLEVPGQRDQGLVAVSADGQRVLLRAFGERADGMRWALYLWDGQALLVDALDPDLTHRCEDRLPGCGAWAYAASMDATGRTVAFDSNNILLHRDADTAVSRVFVRVASDGEPAPRDAADAEVSLAGWALLAALLLAVLRRPRP